MSQNVILLPPSNQFWTQCARHIIKLMPDAANDFSSLRVIVPAFEQAQLLTQALIAELGSHFIPPRMNTLSVWLSMQAPEQHPSVAVSEGERLMSLYAQLREHGWLKKLFSARKNTDLLPLAQTLITLSDELTAAMLPLVLEDGVAHAEQVWHTALAQLPKPAQEVMSDEAQLVWQIWTSQLDGQDAISLRFAEMMRLAEKSEEQLLWLSPIVPEGLEAKFLAEYSKHNRVEVVSNDWRIAGLNATFAKAWPEIVEKEDAVDFVVAQSGEITHITTIAADSLEQEAQWSAQTILSWLQEGKSSIALIAQDRVVARRIRALLERANVQVADETGWKLSTTRAASALAAWFDVVVTRADTVSVLDLIKSPYFQPDSMADFDEKSTWVMQIETALLRANVSGGWDSIIYALKEITIGEQLKQAAAHYVGHKKLSDWLDLTEQTLAEFGILAHWQNDAAGQQLIQLLDKLRGDCAQVSEKFSFSEWRVFINLQLEGTASQGDKSDTRVVMLPLNGARLRQFDAVLVAGCDEKHLPSQPKEVLFFTNAVRRECGLVTREQRQRQQLRDFTELLSVNSDVVLTWQSRQHGEENPVSPWIERLNLCLQRAGLTRLAERKVVLRSQTLPVITPQQPKPIAPKLRPANLSASGYNSFLACPYQFFAGRMLGLSSMDTLSDMPEKRDYGGWLHVILKSFHDALKAQPEIKSAEQQESLLREISNALFDDVLQKSPAALGYRIRWEKTISAYIDWSRKYAESGWQFDTGEIWLEKNLELPNSTITLRGQIDRIDRNPQDEYAVLDYKTNPLSVLNKKLREREDQQLPFYGLLAEQEDRVISSAHYVALEKSYEKLANAAVTDYPARKEKLKQAIVHHMSEIDRGAELVAQGISQVCQYCDVRGLCRKGAW